MALITAAIFFIAPAILIRILASFNILWAFSPANTFSLVTPKGNETGDLTKGGGAVVDIIHNVPGMKLDKSHPDPEEWTFVVGKEKRTILFHLLGVIWIGLFRTLRTNRISRFRYAKKDERPEKDKDKKAGEKGPDYHRVSDDLITKYVPFSGDQAIHISEAETKSIFTIDILLNIIEEARQPLKTVIRVADSNSVLTSMVKQMVNALTGSKMPEYFLQRSPQKDEKLIEAVLQTRRRAFKAIGRWIDVVNVISVDPSGKDRELFELKERNIRQGEAAVEKAKFGAREAVVTAQGQRKAKMLINEADANRVETVIKPAAQDDRTIAVVRAEAYRDNEHVIAVGGTPLIDLPAGK